VPGPDEAERPPAVEGLAALFQVQAGRGVVQWVAGTRMVMWADAGVSLRVDLMRADQRSYTSLRAGDRIVVVGTVAPERDRLLAESITSGAGTIPQDSWRAFPQAP